MAWLALVFSTDKQLTVRSKTTSCMLLAAFRTRLSLAAS
jgi:hypothetical protein